MKKLITRLFKGAGPVARYIAGGRIPWSEGYSKFKNQFIRSTLDDADLVRRFRDVAPLPDGFGPRLDERVVEYPWVLARLPATGWILDAGSTFSSPLLLERPEIKGRRLFIFTLATDFVAHDPNVSYVFGDFREPILHDALFESIVCISTLEHVGMAQSFEYSKSRPFPKADRTAYRDALAQFRRMLKPGGRLLLTVPFGPVEDHGWLQQFDAAGLRDIVATFGDRLVTETYYRYRASGWQLARPEDCADARYFNLHETKSIDPDGAAAARAVACLELVK